MFESLTEKLTGTLGKLNSRGRLSEKDVDEALRELSLIHISEPTRPY